MSQTEKTSETKGAKPSPLPPVPHDSVTGGETGKAEGAGKSESPATRAHGEESPSSPGVDVHAVLGVPRPKRPSKKSTANQTAQSAEDSDSDDCTDSDDDTEEWQEGEYLIMEEDDEELKELQTKMLSENASLSRDILVPIFTACTAAYEKWITENETSTPEAEMTDRRKQNRLYCKVLELYGSDVQWESLTHAQRVERNKEAHDASLQAKELGQLPDVVMQASITTGAEEARETLSAGAIGKTIENHMKNLSVTV